MRAAQSHGTASEQVLDHRGTSESALEDHLRFINLLNSAPTLLETGTPATVDHLPNHTHTTTFDLDPISPLLERLGK